MVYKLHKARGIIFALVVGAAVFGFIFWGIEYSLGTEAKFQTLKLMLLVPAYGFLAAGIYLFLSSLNMEYRATDDELIIRWGLRLIRIPWADIDEVIDVKGKSNLYSVFGAGWPGYMVGLYSARGVGTIRMYATDPWEGFIYVKSKRGFFGLTPSHKDYASLLDLVAQKSGHAVNVVDMNTLDPEIKGESTREDHGFTILYRLNLAFLLLFALYLVIFFPGSGAPAFTVLLLVLAVALFFFTMSNAGRLFQFSPSGGYVLLAIGIAVTGIFMILALSQISL